MSDAKVWFETLSYENAFAATGEQTGEIARFGFACPKHKNSPCSGLLIRTADDFHPSWIWDANHAAPTFSPSIDCRGCWHGYIRSGRCVDVAGVDEPEP